MDARAWILRRKGSAIADAAAPVDWEAVYAEQLPRVYNYFRFRTGDAWLAEDLTAQTFERAWRARATFRPERGDPGAWLLAIARNVAHSHHRRGRNSERPLEAADRPSPEPGPDDLAERHLEALRLRELIANLPAKHRELIALKYGAGLTNREIARLTGQGESSVGTTLHRIVQRLRAAWETPDHDTQP